MTMEMFLEEVRTAVLNTAVKENLKIEEAKVHFDNSLTISLRTGNGRIQCINEKCYRIAAHELAAHTIELEEIWVGYDGEGSSWSDHMGGKIINCTGLKKNAAVELIKNTIIETMKG